MDEIVESASTVEAFVRKPHCNHLENEQIESILVQSRNGFCICVTHWIRFSTIQKLIANNVVCTNFPYYDNTNNCLDDTDLLLVASQLIV